MADNETTDQKPGFADVERAIFAGDVDAPAVLQRFLEAPDAELKNAPTGTIRTPELLQKLTVARRKGGKAQRIKASTAVWRTFLTQPAPLPERFFVAEAIVRLYQEGNSHGVDAGRQLLLRLINEVPWHLGFFGGIKRVGKIAEDELDAVTWAAVYGRAQSAGGTSSTATRNYMSKRAWRFLRDLGNAMPDLYPWWAAEFLLRCASWTSTSGHIARSMDGKSRSISKRITESWSKSAEPLLLIVQGANYDYAVKSAWEATKKQHADVAKAPSAAFIKGLLRDDNRARHDVFVDLTKLVPNINPSYLVQNGLADDVAGLLVSRSKDARAFAIAFLRSEKNAVPLARLVELQLKAGLKEVADIIKAIPARDIGPTLLVKLLGDSNLSSFAEKALLEQFTVAELGEQLLIDLAYDDDDDGFELFQKLEKKHGLPTSLYKHILEDDRLENNYNLPDHVVEALAKKPSVEVGADWLLDIVARKKDKLASDVASWLKDTKKFPELGTPSSLERARGFLFDKDLQEVGLAILGNKHLVTPANLGIPWLLSLARRKDTTLSSFANRTLLEHMAPKDFAPAGGTAEQGIEHLFELALSSTETPALRTFAQTYLRNHHPEIGEQQPEAKQLGLKPQLGRAAYTIERLWPALKSVHDDIRRFAVTIAKSELRRWNAMGRLGEIADTDHVDVRRLALDALLKADDASADPAHTANVEELSPETIFPLTESRRRPVREAGMELIRRHYGRLGGQERLAWLMTSADREVRLFAVRILWEKHRPRAFPSSWAPKKTVLDADVLAGTAGTFSDAEALRGFLRRVLFALPPGRSMEARDDASFRRIPSSVAKARVVEIVRDLGVEDADFAAAVRPLLEEMTASLAKGEWQACLQALVAIDAAHGRPTVSASTTSSSTAASDAAAE
ncbi:MAG TPA: hypothetical protein VGF99_09255 [Myxococcota bacterium]